MDKKNKLKSLKCSMSLKPGDVVLTNNVNFAYDKNGEPKYDNIKKQKKRRPFIVLSGKVHNENQITVSGIFGTSNTEAVDISDPFTIKLPPSEQTGLYKETYFDITQIQPVHKNTISGKIGEISSSDLEHIYYLMLQYYGLLNFEDEDNDNDK